MTRPDRRTCGAAVLLVSEDLDELLSHLGGAEGFVRGTLQDTANPNVRFKQIDLNIRIQFFEMMGGSQTGNSPTHDCDSAQLAYPSGVNPRTISNRACNSPIRESGTFLKSTSNEFLAFSSLIRFSTPSFRFWGSPLM